MISRYLIRTTASVAAVLALAAPAAADGTFQIVGGGDGHGIGMSQYGAYGYALHGKSYRFILGHYYRNTELGRTNPSQIVRVLLATGSASFSGATYAPHKWLNPNRTYSVQALADGTLTLYDQQGRKVGTFKGPLSVGGPGPLLLAGHGSYRGWLEFRPAGAGAAVQTVNALHLEDYVRGVVSYEMPASWAPEALKTQAVAARTYAITSTVNGNGYQLYTDTRSQMYGGVAAETPSTDAAVHFGLGLQDPVEDPQQAKADPQHLPPGRLGRRRCRRPASLRGAVPCVGLPGPHAEPGQPEQRRRSAGR